MKIRSFAAVDLFAGCGGISEGFTSAGFKVAASLEYDHHAAETLRSRAAFHEFRNTRWLSDYNRYLCEEISFEELLRKFPALADRIEGSVIEKEFGEHHYISGIERGTPNPTILSVARVAAALKTSLAQLFNGVAK